MSKHNGAITLAMTGASGAQYGFRLLQCLLAANYQVYLLLSRAAEVVIDTETEMTLPPLAEGGGLQDQHRYLCRYFAVDESQLHLPGREDWFSPVASGSSSPTNMVICPASGGNLSALAHGASNNLIERAADVVLKERRKLILVPRETPYSSIHLENMLKLSRAGAIILPASPGFYQRPNSIKDMVDFIVARILDQLSIPQQLMPRWGESP